MYLLDSWEPMKVVQVHSSFYFYFYCDGLYMSWLVLHVKKSQVKPAYHIQWLCSFSRLKLLNSYNTFSQFFLYLLVHERRSWTFNEQKRYIYLYLKDEFKTTWGWVNDDTIFMLWRTIPFRIFSRIIQSKFINIIQ